MHLNTTRLRKLGILAVAAALSITTVAACGGDDSGGSGSGDGPTKVAIGTQPWIGYGPFYIAEAKGFDKQNGVDIDLVSFSTDQDLETGFASGKFQGANNANNTLIRLADLGLDYKIVLMEDISLEADAVLSCDENIKSVGDIPAGTSVAFEEFSVSDLLFRYALKEAGGNFDELDYKPIPAADAGTAAVAGRVPIATTYEPYLQAALAEGDNCEIIYTAGERPGLISDSLAMNAQFAEENPDAVEGVLRAWGDAVDYYNSNTKDAQAIIAKAVGEKPGALTDSFNGVELFDLQKSLDFLENDYEALWKEIAAILEEEGQIESIPDVSKYLDTSFGEKALND